jgi:protocatechuate 3,4-dioxygenase beta subunit
MTPTFAALRAGTAVAVLALTAIPLTRTSAQSTPGPASRPPAGLIVGRVVDAAMNRPIARALVTLVTPQPAGDAAINLVPPTPANTPRVYTDADGRFLFRGLAAGRYTFLAAAQGYLDGGYGQRRIGGPTQPFTLAENERVGDVTIRLWKEATLAGEVTDETGTPIPEIWVTVLRRDGNRGMTFMNRAGSSESARTDDKGAYRITGLVPGEYVVAVPSRMIQWPATWASLDAQALQSMRATGLAGITPASAALRFGEIAVQTSEGGNYGGSNMLAAILPTTLRPDGRLVGYVQTFHPSATSVAAATRIALTAGDARTGVDIQIRPMALTRVSGQLLGPGGPQANTAVHLVPAFAAHQMLERTHETAVTTTNAAGAFTFLGVPPGQYVLKAWTLPVVLVIGRDPMPADKTLWSELAVTVGDTPLTDLTATLRPGLTIAGRVIFEGTAPAPNPAQAQTALSVAFEPVWPLAFTNRLGVRANANGEFITQGLPRGTYVPILPNQFGQRGWYFESAKLGGRDLFVEPIVLDSENVSGIEITFSDRRTELTGVVTNATGAPDAAAAVVVFPAEYQRWIERGLSPLASRTTLASQTGTYFMQMRPGDFLVAAVREEILANWPQAATVESIAPTATRVTIARGQTARLDVKRGGR